MIKVSFYLLCVLLSSVNVLGAWTSQTVDELSANQGHGNSIYNSVVSVGERVYAAADDYGTGNVYLRRRDESGNWTTIDSNLKMTYPFLANSQKYLFLAEQRIYEDKSQSCLIKRYDLSTEKAEVVYDPGNKPEICTLVAPIIIGEGWISVISRYRMDNVNKMQFLISYDEGANWISLRDLPLTLQSGRFGLIPLKGENAVFVANNHPKDPGISVYSTTIKKDLVPKFTKIYEKTSGRLANARAKPGTSEFYMGYIPMKDGVRDGSDKIEIIKVEDTLSVKKYDLPVVDSGNFAYVNAIVFSADNTKLLVAGADLLKGGVSLFSTRELDLEKNSWQTIEHYSVNEGGAAYSIAYDNLTGGILSGGEMLQDNGIYRGILRSSVP